MGQPTVRVPWVSWGTLTVVSAIVAASALWVAFTPAGDQTELTGRTWEGFALQDPEVANLYSMDLNILGLLGAGFGLLAAVVSVIPYRRGERWAWYALWLLPVTIGGVATRMLIDQYPTGLLRGDHRGRPGSPIGTDPELPATRRMKARGGLARPRDVGVFSRSRSGPED